MNIRKLVKAGAASFTIALPKDWITGNNLKKGDSIYVNESGNELVISAEFKEKPASSKEAVIEIDNKSMGTIQRELTSAYINNYTAITLTGKDLYRKVSEIRKILGNFVALEVTEQTSTSLIARDMLNLKEVSIEKTIRRVDNIVRSIFKDLHEPKKDVIESVNYRDSDINRLYFLLFKIIKTAMSDSQTAKTVGINDGSQTLSLWYLILNLENISDDIKTVYALSVNLKEFDAISGLIGKIESSYLEVMKAYYSSDRKLADSVASSRNGIIDECAEISEKSKNTDVIKITESLKEIENFICNIARLVLDKE